MKRRAKPREHINIKPGNGIVIIMVQLCSLHFSPMT